MIHGSLMKTVVALPPASIATNATATGGAIDTKGFRYAVVELFQNAASATNSSATLASIDLKEGDTTSSYSTISGCGGLTAASGTSFAMGVNNDTTYGATIRFGVDLRGRKRYLNLTCTNKASSSGVTTVSALCHLYRAEQTPNSTTEAGVINWVQA